tara:strand:+ start:590 stop:1099 length:510 start_codon:yes stop_codon:yes gene_type:complete
MNLLNVTKKIKNNIFKTVNIFYITIILIVFFLDRYSKSKIIAKFNDKQYYFNDYINFDLVWNSGIGFGLLSTFSPLIYGIITVFISLVIFFLVYLVFCSEFKFKLIFSIIIGGAIGNLYDRIVFKAVPDFIDFHYQNFHWFTFNLADIFISIGVITYIFVDSIKYKKNV